MDDLIIMMMVIVFPILIYLLFSTLSILINKRVSKIMFIITMMTSLYLDISFCKSDMGILFGSIPIMICYLKKEELLGIILSLVLIIDCYINNMMLGLMINNLILYYVIYIITNKKKIFNYLYMGIILVIEIIYIIIKYHDIKMIFYMMIIYIIIYFCLYLFKIAMKITNLYEMVNEMEKINNLKDSLFKLTHEIKNPIAVCKGYLEMINLNDMEKSTKYINIIRSEIDRSLNVMSDFMEYSKIKIKKEIFDLNILLEDINENYNLLFIKNNIRYEYTNECEELYVNGDYERIKQVIVNVIKNSIESISNSGIIKMNVLILDKMVSINIIDNGIGMNSDEMENLFKMFYTTKKNGTGLGVALSKEIIDAHNGSISYESEKGKGTKCIISIPL